MESYPAVPDKSDYLYFVVARKAGMLKIGRTEDLKRRLIQLNYEGPLPVREPLELFGFVRLTRDAAQIWEVLMHRFFAPDRIKGEWFWFTPRVEEFLADAIMEPENFS